MAETFIELWADTEIHDGQRNLRGNKAAYEALEAAARNDPANVKLRAVAHNRDAVGAIPSTLFHVVAPQADIDALTTSHVDHDDHGLEAGTYRGIELLPGTATNTEVNDLADRIQNDIGTDIRAGPEEVPPGSGQTAAAYLRDTPSIGTGNWRCTHPDHQSPEVNPVGTPCSLNHSSDLAVNEHVDEHRRPFDPTNWLVG